jgi:hypothetical protein
MTTNVKEPKIIQIIPAADWYAVFEEGTPTEEQQPLACWALTDEGDVIGQISMENFIDNAENYNNFSKYRHSSEKRPAAPEYQYTPQELAERQAHEEKQLAEAMRELELGV